MSVLTSNIAGNNYSVNSSFDTPAGFSQGSAPFRTSALDIWVPLAQIAGAGNRPLTVFHSADNGVTWNSEDALNGPIHSGSFACVTWWDGAQFLTALELDAITSSIHLRKFDTVAKTWGAAFALGGPSAAGSNCNAIFIRSDTQVAVLYQDNITNRNSMTLWNGAAWSAPTTFDDNSAGVGFTSVATWIDSIDRIHVLGIFTSSVLLAYQRINANSSLGPYIDLAANGLLFFDDAARNATDSFSITLNPAENSVVIGGKTAAYPNGRPCLLTGTPLANLANPAAWSLGAALHPLDHSMYPQVYYDGTNPVLLNQWENISASNEPDIMRVGGNNPIVWSDVATVIPPHLLFPVFRVSATEALAAYGGWDGDGVNFFKVQLSAIGVAGSTSIYPIQFAPKIPLPDTKQVCKGRVMIPNSGRTFSHRRKRGC